MTINLRLVMWKQTGIAHCGKISRTDVPNDFRVRFYVSITSVEFLFFLFYSIFSAVLCCTFIANMHAVCVMWINDKSFNKNLKQWFMLLQGSLDISHTRILIECLNLKLLSYIYEIF